MQRLNAAGASPGKSRRRAAPSQTSHDQSIGVCDCRPNPADCNVLASRRSLARYALTFAACAAFLLTIAAVGLAVEWLAGVGGLWVLAGVFVVVVMAAMRHEGVL